MGFVGGNLTADGEYNTTNPKYFTEYGNLTVDLQEVRNAENIAAEIQAFEDRAGISLQVSLN